MVPHAPLLLPELGGSRGGPIVDAVGAIDLSGVDAVVVASPHGRATGVYRAPEGNLDAFGPRGLDASADPDDAFAEELAAAWARPVLEDPADHGVVVPLRLLATPAPVVAVAFEEGIAPDQGTALARAITSAGRDVAFVASANLSAGLNDRSPLPSLPGAGETDAAVLESLQNDPAKLLDQVHSLERAGSCAAPVLAAFGALFAGRPCEVLVYGAPFGVGYPVAVTR